MRRPPLTDIQDKIWNLDRQGMTPTQIAARTGLGLSRVANVKARLKQMGYEVTEYKRRRKPLCVCEMLDRYNLDLANVSDELERRKRELEKLCSDLIRVKKEHDRTVKETTKFRGYCRCGLSLPCNKCTPKSAAELATNREYLAPDTHGGNSRMSVTGRKYYY